MTNFPEIKIQCDESYQTETEWTDCDQTATHMLSIQHYGSNCETQVYALCTDHLDLVWRNIQHVKNYIKHYTNPTCRHCKQPIDASMVGKVTRI